MIRKARIEDAYKIYDLIQPYVKREILLPRSIETICSEIELTWVLEKDKKIQGTLSLTPFEQDLYELRAMVTSQEAQSQGLGTSLLLEAEKFIKNNLHLPIRLFALTYDPSFFLKNGFQQVSKDIFPQKIYDVCHFCTRKHECREIAVKKILS